MIDEHTKVLIEHRLEKSEDALRAAQYMLEQGLLIFSMNRIYYSMYYAVQALLALKGKSFSKHGQVKGYFNREFVKSGRLPKEMGRLYNKAFEYRQKFDYVDFIVPEEPMIEEYIKKANDFCEQLRKFIAKLTQ
jgi:uncharacterized protein (UPF0332 family)